MALTTTIKELASATLSRYSRRGGRLLAGALAFYAMLSIAPLCLIALQVAGTFLGEAEARTALEENLERWVGASGATTIFGLVARVNRPGGGPRAVLTLVLLFYASTRLFSQLKRALDILWDVPIPERKGFVAKLKNQLEKRALSFVLACGVGIVLVAIVLVKTAFSLGEDSIGAHSAGASRVLATLVSFAVTVVMFAIVLRVLPTEKIPWRDAFLGALVTAVLFTVGTNAVSAYLGHKGVHATYGEAGAVIVLVLWMHYSTQVFLIGAAFTGESALRRGKLKTRAEGG
ncbi:N/A [soil metagenome]